MPTIYVLLCESNRYYVGKTERPLLTRIEEHFRCNGSEWTKKYKPIRIVETIPNADEFDEDKYTKKYMKKYGISKVRGGTYTQINLSDYQELSLEKELCSASDLCFRCNRPGHFASQCYASTKSDGTRICDESESEDGEWCWCCVYCHKEFDTEREAERHERLCGKKRYNSCVKEEPKRQKCFRCGRDGHYANECYASSHINGKWL